MPCITEFGEAKAIRRACKRPSRITLTLLPLMQDTGDLFTLSADGQALMINAAYVKPLQEEPVGEDGASISREPTNDVLDLILHWVYGMGIFPSDLVGIAQKHVAVLHTSQDDMCCSSRYAAKAL